MNQDKALKKVLEDRFHDELSSDFNVRTMHRIMRATARQKKRIFILQLCLVSIVSAGLVFFTFFFVKDHTGKDFVFFALHIFRNIYDHVFAIYIALLALFLLMMDMLFRKKINKKHAGIDP